MDTTGTGTRSEYPVKRPSYIASDPAKTVNTDLYHN